MALVKEFVHKPAASVRYRTEVECGWTIADTRDGRILHLETYGSGARAIPGKVSQSIELDESAARELRRILDRAFPAR